LDGSDFNEEKITMTNGTIGTQAISNRMLRQSRTKEELAKRMPIVLTDRDKDILTAIYIHGFLTTELIELAFFPEPSHGRRSPCSRAYDRLQQLWRWAYAERVEQPIARSAGGRRPYLYALGRAGEPVVAQRLGQGVTRVQRRRLDRLSSVFVDHDLRIATFWANMIALLRSTHARLGRWLPERELRARKIRIYDPRTGWWLPVLPDAAFEVVYPDGCVQACLLEVDMGTLTLKRFRRKVRAFELDLAQGLGAVLPGSSFEVLVLTHSQGRLQQLWRVARDEVPPERWGAYSFGTFDLLGPAGFARRAGSPPTTTSCRCSMTMRSLPQPRRRQRSRLRRSRRPRIALRPRRLAHRDAEGGDPWSRSDVRVVCHLACPGALSGAYLPL
jgi:hypothetical protein